MAYLAGSFQNLEVVLELHSRDPRRLRGDGSSRDRVVLVDGPALGKLVRGSKPIPSFEVPLLSREGLTRRLLPGAAAPWSPALDPVSKFPAVARFVLFPAAARSCFYFDLLT